MNQLAAILMLWVVALPIHAQSAADLLKAGSRMRGVIVPLYDKTDHTCLSVVRVDRAYTAPEHKGYFQIGAAPMRVLEGVTIEIRQTNRLTNCLDQLNRWLIPPDASRLELHLASIECGPSSRIDVGRIKIAEHGVWNLLEGVTLVQGDQSVKGPQARLYTTGDRAGEVVMVTSTNVYFLGEKPTIPK